MSGAKDRVRLWLRLLKVVRDTEAALRDNLRRDFETTLPRFDMLAALSRYPSGLKMSVLSGVLRVSNGNVTGLADRLTEEGLVERQPVPGDRRAMILKLTLAGQKEFAAQAAAHEGWIDDLLGGISAEDARQMAARLYEHADRQDKKKEPAHAQ